MRWRREVAGPRYGGLRWTGPRYLQGVRTLREQMQSPLHRALAEALCAPLTRSAWSDALASRPHRPILEADMAPLFAEAPARAAGSSVDVP
jgi:hypothetical protein